MIDSLKKNLLVVGNGMTSQSFCRWLTDGGGCPFSVTVFGEEVRPAYDRVHLTDYFSGKSAADLELAPRHWYRERGIDLITGTRVTRIDIDKRELSIASGEVHPFDELVLATGSGPFVPPVPGVANDGVFVYRTIEDLEAISEASKNARSAAVLGGGLLGLEAAKALRDLGLVVHVVEMAPGLMPRQLDRESGLVLQRRVEAMGVQVHLTKRTQSIERHGDYLIINFDLRDSLAVDMVVISAGIRPRDELARQAGLKIGDRGGIAVNDKLQTSAPHIHAIGECVSHRDTVYGLVGPCIQMAKVLASQLKGEESTFTGGDQSAKLKLLGTKVTTYGEPIGASTGSVLISGASEVGSLKLLVRESRLVGAIGVGEWPESERIGAAVTERRRLWGWQLRRFRDSGRIWPASDAVDVTAWAPQAVVCGCVQVRRSDLTSACQRGCDTVEALAAATGASTVCGSCRPLLAQMVGKVDDAIEMASAWRGLLIASVMCFVVLLAFWSIGPIEFSDSVATARRRIDFIWRDDFWKQVTGYLLVAVMAISLLLSLRKRWKLFSLGSFGSWRLLHSVVGVTTLFGALAHTGMHMGSNLNFYLMSCFLSLNLLGAIAGVVTALESRAAGPVAMVIRQWRPRLTLLHIVLFWPMPILIAAHVFGIYFY